MWISMLFLHDKNIIKHILNPNTTSLATDDISASSNDFWEFLSSSY